MAKKELKDLKPMAIISESVYQNLSLKYGHVFEASIGAEALRGLLERIDLGKTAKKLEKELEEVIDTKKEKIIRRLKLIKSLKQNNIRPEWMVLSVIPVIPPDLRPMVALDGGRFATSDLNDLYRRVSNRNNRLKKLINQGAPEVICRNEKRMLQEAVDALIDNSARKGKMAYSAGGKRKLRSLSDMIRGKQGRFRQNLLGKRVDYSGRSVIVVGPNLNLYQCGIPKVMALELFKPFVIGRLIKDGYVHNVKNATRLIEKGESFVWDILEEITENHHVLLNRAPTLHRLGIQAFQPVLIEGKAIQIHPLVCAAFNADFDGDQMAVHVPLSKQAQREAEEIMLSSKNLLKPASGEPIVTPEKDIILGLYYITREVDGDKTLEKAYINKNTAISEYDRGRVGIHQRVRTEIDGSIVSTTVGRIMANETLPEGYEFVNEVFDKKRIKKIVTSVYQRYGKEATSKLVDDMKKLGFAYAERSGVTFSVYDIMVPESKKSILREAEEKLSLIYNQFQKGFLTEEERYGKTVELWMDVSSKVEGEMSSNFDKNNDIHLIMNSGARGNVSQLNQIAGMKGLVADPTGNIIELPIRSNFKEGLSVFEYFVSTHGSRKGRADTALRTSEAGYLTRRLVDVSQDTVVLESDCGTENFRLLERSFYEERGKSWDEHILGRVLAKDCAGHKKGELINKGIVDKINHSGESEIGVYSYLGCEAQKGVCQKCYGEDPATGEIVVIGATVGIVAAQAIGEPGTQLTMRTFHTGGAAGEDITSGLPRVEDIFERQTPKAQAVVSKLTGVITDIKKGEKEERIIVVLGEEGGAKKEKKEVEHSVSFRRNPIVKVGQEVKAGDLITDGYADIDELFRYGGMDRAQRYIISEINKIYETQGASISRKHVEIIVRQMFSRRKIKHVGDTRFSIGNIVEETELNEENARVEALGQEGAKGDQLVLGITEVALTKESFLSAASFQSTSRVLIEAAVQGSVAKLYGLKENVILGRLIPAGTGFHTNRVEPEYDERDDEEPREIVQA